MAGAPSLHSSPSTWLLPKLPRPSSLSCPRFTPPARNFLPRTFSLVCRAELEPQPSKKQEKIVVPDFFEIDRADPNDVLKLLFESDQALETARHYEVVFLVHENSVDELQDVIKKVKDFIKEKKGKVWRLNDWGMRKLAYKIQKAKRANYILMNVQIAAQAINEFKTLLDKDERIIRHLVITRKNAMMEKTEPPPEYSSLTDDADYSDESDNEYEDGDNEEYEDGDEEEYEETVNVGESKRKLLAEA